MGTNFGTFNRTPFYRRTVMAYTTNPQDIIEETDIAKWVDPRSMNDRRKSDNEQLIPVSGCRRKGDRRKRTFVNVKEWWLLRDYSQTIVYSELKA